MSAFSVVTYQNAGALALAASAVAFCSSVSTTDARNVPGLDMTPSALIWPIRPAPTRHTPFLESTGRNGGGTGAREAASEELDDDDDRPRRLLLKMLLLQHLRKYFVCVVAAVVLGGGGVMVARPTPMRTRRAITISAMGMCLPFPHFEFVFGCDVGGPGGGGVGNIDRKWKTPSSPLETCST